MYNFVEKDICLGYRGDFMESNIRLTPSQKIKQLREFGKYTQEALAEALKCSKSKISKVESGEWEYSEEDIKAAKEFFGVENAPLTERERLFFRQHLYKWKDLIRNGLVHEARKNQKNFAVITKLPFEPDLYTLYRMFEIRLVLKEAKPELAEETLLAEEPHIEQANYENQHHFYYNMGSVYLYRFNFKIALQFYLKSRDLEAYALERDVGLYLNLSMCYGELGKYALAVGTIEKVYHESDYNKTGVSRAYIDSVLAINYVRIGQVARAKQLLDKSLAEVMGSNNKFFIHMALHNYGCACFKAKEYAEAIKYFDQVFEIYEKIDNYYLENMYWKIRCLIADKKTSKARPLLSKAMSLAEGNTHFLLAFESLAHLLSINNDESIEFIEQKTIPYFIDRREYYRVLDYCELLENIFKKRGKGYKIRALEMASTIRNITKEITFGEEVTT